MKGTVQIFFIIMAIMLCAGTVKSQDETDGDFEEILIFMRVQGVGGLDMNAIYSYDHDRLYLPVENLFNFLKINQKSSQSNQLISGFFIDENRLYEISHADKIIRIDGKEIPLSKEDILRTETGLYLYTGVFGKAFGLECSFSFRSMSVLLKTDLELPAIRDMRLEQMRKNLEQLRGEIQVDTTIDRKHHLFRFGMADWAFSSTQITNKTTDNRFGLALGMELLGGEANFYLNTSTREKIALRNQQYLWRYVNNEGSIIRQVKAGKINSGSIATLYDPLHGFIITNAGTTFRRSFGEYTLSDYTEPGWTVELYVNNVLVAYQVADPSGYFTFDVPLVYGSSEVMLKFYGPYGEERIREQFINIPFNFLPAGELEYTVTGGLVQDTLNSTFGRASVNYGINRFITVGGGIEHLSSITTGSEIPFATTSIAPFRNLMMSGEYAYGVKMKALVSYRLPSNLSFDFEHNKYESEQKAISFNYLEERKAILNLPFKIKKFKGSFRGTYKQNVYETLKYNTADGTFGTSLGQVSLNISGSAIWISENNPNYFGSMTMGFRLPFTISFRPQIQYDFTKQEIVSIKAEFDKRIHRSGNLSLIFQEMPVNDFRSVELSFRWDLSFAQFNTSARLSNFDLTTTQGARGGLAFGSRQGHIHTDNRSSIGRGGLIVTPFLDINHNRVRDLGEPLATGLTVKVNGGRMLSKAGDTLIRVIELEPYTGYLLELDDASLDNIAWQLPFKVMRVMVDPNQFKKIDIPVQPGGEVNGMVTLREGRRSRGLSRVLVNIHRADGTYVTRVMSESDGYITYLGLPPGDFYAQPDPEQMERIGMQSSPDSIPFTIIPMDIGDIVDGLDFELTRIEQKSSDIPENQNDSHAGDYSRDTIPKSEKEIELAPKTPKPQNEKTPEQNGQNLTNKPVEGPDTLRKEEVPANQDKTRIINDPSTPNVAPAEPVDTVTSAKVIQKEGDFSMAGGKYYLQAGAFSRRENAERAQQKYLQYTRVPSGIVFENGMYKVRFGYFNSLEELKSCQEELSAHGIRSYQQEVE